MSVINERAIQLAPIAGRYSVLNVVSNKNALAATKRIFSGVKAGIYEVSGKLDSSTMDREDVMRWLMSLPINDNLVTAYWQSLDEGLFMAYKDFVKYYDDLWFPSADDVILFGECETWALQLNHEEEFVFVQRRL